MKSYIYGAAIVAALMASTAASATGIGQGQEQGQGQSQGQGQTATGGTGVGIGVGKGGDAFAGASSQSGALAGAAAVGVNRNSAGASSEGQSAAQSVTGDRTQYDSFAFGYAAPGLSIHNSGVVGDETVTLPNGFQFPAIGGGWNDTDRKPTIGFEWRTLPVVVRAFYEDVSDTPEQRAQSEFVRAFACEHLDYLDRLPEITPYGGCR